MKKILMMLGLCSALNAYACKNIKMNISHEGLNLIKNFEGFRSYKYRDAVGKWTIGFGHLIEPHESFDRSITEAEGENLLRDDLFIAESAVRNLVKVPLDQHQFDALVSLVYNWGAGNFSKCYGLILLNQGDYKGAEDHFDSVTNHGLSGLVRRRHAEEKEYFE